MARLLVIGLALSAATFATRLPVISASDPARTAGAEAGVAVLSSRPGTPAAATPASRAGKAALGAQAISRLPISIGDQIAGTFDDATGHSAQSHLVYAANSRVWWLFTLTSTADSEGGANHFVKSFRSSGPDLATATWTPGADSPAVSAGAPNQSLGGGRSLGIAYLNNSPVDVIHADISMASNGQDGRTGHIRAVLTGTSITWASWNFFDEPAATWTLPRANTIGVSTGKFIHTGGPILQQEVDANARKSNNADTGSSWTSGFSLPAVIDGSMLNQANALAFAPLANNVMLAVYDNGQNAEPNQTNLRYKRSSANGVWSSIVVGSQLGGDGNVFATNAVINQNDWALVPVSTSQIFAFRRRANGTGVDAASYNVAANNWSSMSPAPPTFGVGQSFKSGAGLFGATDGNSVWLCAINTDVANSILCTRFDGTAWTPWSTVAGTDIGIQNRNYISGSPVVGNNQIGLIWTEGRSLYDVVVYSLAASPDVKAPAVSMTTPLDGATVSGTIPVSAGASDNAGVAGVQFRLDGADLGAEVTAAPYTTQWNTATAANGAHVLTAIARDEAGNTATAAEVSVTVANIQTPIITWPTPQKIAAGTPLGPTQLNARANTTGTFVYTPPAGTVLPIGPGQVLSVLFTPTDPASFTTATASVRIDVVNLVPDVVGLTRTAATTSLVAAGLAVGTVTQASSATVPSGSVISQSPTAGTQVAANSAVNLVVSSGPPQISVPTVVGLTQVAATAAITNAGFVLGAVTTATSPTVPSGSVISQTPSAGSQAATGSAVAIVVSSGPPQVSVPAVVGLTQAAATTAITNAGLTVGAVTTASSATVPAGSVTSQTPAANTQVASGSTVALVVSSGPPQVQVPNVVGLTQTAATGAITTAGLKLGAVTTASSTTVPSGSVISQTPVAGTQVTSGSAVALVVSSGSPQVAVPNVVGLTQTAATTAITSAGLTAGAVTTASSTTVPSGSVISQTPAAGTQVTSGSAVALVVSSGPPQVAVPNVVGLTQTAAGSAISSAGLTVGAVTTAPSTTVASGSVISQTPAAGTQVTSGSAVALVVSSGLPQVAVPSVVGLTQAAATTAITNAGLTLGAVTTAPSTTVASGSVISQTPAAGTQVTSGSAVALVVSSGPPQVAVPNVVGLTQTAAGSAISSAGLTVGAVTTASSTTVPSGSVISQTPAAGTQVTSGSTVALVVSSGLPQVAVPNVAGLTQTAASSAITSAGLKVGAVTTASSTTVPSGSVISQAPSAGTQVASGSTVALVVSSGPPQVAVPNVVGLPQAAATNSILSAGLTLNSVTTAPSAIVAAGLVISQTPVAGAQVPATTSVNLVISSGPPLVSVPNVVGLTQAAASTAITNAGLTVGAITTASSTIVPAGAVIEQSPVSTTPVVAGSAVALLVSSGPPAPATLTIDNTISVDGSGTLTTPPFSTKAADEMLVLFATSMGPTALSLKQSLAISGAGLDWALVNRVNSQFGTAEIWKAYASAPLVNATVTSVQSLTVAGGFHQSLTLIAFQGAGGTGAIGAASAMFGATIGSLTTTRPGSLVYGVANDSARAAARTIGPNQTMVHQWIDTLGASTFWVQALSAPVDAAGSVATISDVTPTSDRWNLATVEILVGSTAASPTVPNVVGLTQTTATTTLTDAGFIVGDVTTASSTTVPSGIVLSQTPAAFARAATGSAVAIVVSSGPPKVAVPSVVGVTQAAATTAITNAGLVVGGVSTASSTTVPSGSVISQTPAAATQVATGSSVSFVVSTGAPQVAVPNVVGLTQAAAATAIANSGLVVGGITTEPSTTVPAGSVTSQTPTAATQVSTGSSVSLVVSAGSPQVVVPNLVGLTQAGAASALAGVGLSLGSLTSAPSTTVPIGSVISQTPIAGATLLPGSTVDIVISEGQASGTPEVDITVAADGGGTVTTPAFSTTGSDELLVAFASSDGPSIFTGQTVNITGAGLVWTLARRANTQSGTAEVWTATAPGPLSNAVVTSTQSSNGFHQSLTVVAFSGASGIGDVAPAGGRRTTPSVSLITTQPGSLVYGVGVDPDRPSARTLPSNQTMVHQWVDRGDNRTFWVQAFASPVADGGSVATVNCIGPSNDDWNMVAVEIMAR